MSPQCCMTGSKIDVTRLFKAKFPVSFTTDCFLLSYLTVAQRNLCLLLSFHLSVLLNLFSSIFAAFCSPCTKQALHIYLQRQLSKTSRHERTFNNSSPVSHLTVPNQAFVADDSRLLNSDVY